MTDDAPPMEDVDVQNQLNAMSDRFMNTIMKRFKVVLDKAREQYIKVEEDSVFRRYLQERFFSILEDEICRIELVLDEGPLDSDSAEVTIRYTPSI